MCVPYLLLLRVPHSPSRTPPLRGKSKDFPPLVPLRHPPFATSLTPLLPGKPLHHTRHIVVWLALPYVRFLLLFPALRLYPFFLSFPPFSSLSPSLSLFRFLSFYARASHIADSSHTVAEVGGLQERSLGFLFFSFFREMRRKEMTT